MRIGNQLHLSINMHRCVTSQIAPTNCFVPFAVAEFPPGLESLMQAAWQVPFPDSSIIGRSPRGGGACTADSSHSDGRLGTLPFSIYSCIKSLI